MSDMSNEQVEGQEPLDAEVEQVVNEAWRWYVIHAYSGFEAYVKKVLESRVLTSEFKQSFGRILNLNAN